MRRVLVLAVAAVMAGCGGSGGGGGTPIAATPTFTPAGGTYTAALSVTISTSTAGATIHYTTDGSAPTANSTTYTTPVSVTVTGTTLRAIATASGATTSAVGAATYTIDAAATPAATPVITPGTGSYGSAQSVTITCATSGASIYYTTNGSTPTSASTPYTGAIAVSATTTVRAIATATGYTASAAASATLSINLSTADFATFCAALNADVTAAQVSCWHWNPSLVTDRGVDCASMTAEVTAGRLVYDPAHAADCRAAIQAMGCNLGGEPAACRLALVGQLANGASCYNGISCANGDCTSSTTSACPGVCAPYAAAGSSCATATCAPGLECDGAMTPLCRVPSAAGGACPCQAGLYCDATAKCAAQKTSGPCPTYSECAVGYQCSGSLSPVCLPLVGAGSACSPTTALCGEGYTCTAAVCVNSPSAGQPCTGAGSPCLNATCNGTTCVANLAPGQACTSGALPDCQDGYCGPGGTCVSYAMGTCSAPPPPPPPTLYDSLAGSTIDGSKWQGGASTRTIVAGAAVLGVDVTNMKARSIRGDQYASALNLPASAASRVTTLQADIMVPAATAAVSGAGTIRAAVRLFYSPPGQRLNFPFANQDLLLAEVGLRDDGAGLTVYRQIIHCDDASCATFSVANITFVDPPSFTDLTPGVRGALAAYDTPYTMSVGLDETTRTLRWTISGGAFGSTGLSGSADPAAYLAATAAWTGVLLENTGFQGAQIGVRGFDIGTGGGSARIAGRFDNVLVGRNNAVAVLYDDFSGTGSNSGPADLSPAKWGPPGTLQAAPSGGTLLVHHHVSGAVNPATGNVIGGASTYNMNISDPVGVNALLVDVNLTGYATSGTSAYGVASLTARFINDGSGNISGSLAGDIATTVFVNQVTAGWNITRPSTGAPLGSGNFPISGLGAHRLMNIWNPVTRRFTFAVDSSQVTVDPAVLTSAATPPVLGVTTPIVWVGAGPGPAMAPLKGVASQAGVTTNTLGTSTTLDVRFSNVYTGP